MRSKERERAEALELIRDALFACGPHGDATLLIIDDGGRPSSSGRTHRLQVHVMRPAQVVSDIGKGWRPSAREYLTINVARALGYRLSKDEQIVMGGYVYSRPHHLASALAGLAGHALHCESMGAGIGNVTGWVDPP